MRLSGKLLNARLLFNADKISYYVFHSSLIVLYYSLAFEKSGSIPEQLTTAMQILEDCGMVDSLGKGAITFFRLDTLNFPITSEEGICIFLVAHLIVDTNLTMLFANNVVAIKNLHIVRKFHARVLEVHQQRAPATWDSQTFYQFNEVDFPWSNNNPDASAMDTEAFHPTTMGNPSTYYPPTINDEAGVGPSSWETNLEVPESN